MADPADTVRLLTGLTATEVTADEITTLLKLNDGQPKVAAADALEIAAGRLTSITSDDVTVDGSKRAAVLLTRAQQLRGQHADDQADDEFAVDVLFDSPHRPELTERGVG